MLLVLVYPLSEQAKPILKRKYRVFIVFIFKSSFKTIIIKYLINKSLITSTNLKNINK
jgi:hypothetical protein